MTSSTGQYNFIFVCRKVSLNAYFCVKAKVEVAFAGVIAAAISARDKTFNILHSP